MIPKLRQAKGLTPLLVCVALLLLLPLVSAGTITGGTITTTNVTWYFNNTITVDSISAGTDYLLIEDDNISIVPNQAVDIAVRSYQDSNTHSFNMTSPSSTVTYDIKISGSPARMTYNGAYKQSPFTSINGWALFTYNLGTNLNITFRDQEDDSLITANITFEIFDDEESYSYWTTDGALNLSLGNKQYTLRYDAPGYQERTHIIDTNSENGAVTYYLINDTANSNITFIIVDEQLSRVEGAIVKSLKYFVDDNQYKLQESSETNQEGVTVQHLTMNDEYYKFVVQYGGETVKITNPAYITSTQIEIQISLEGDSGQELEDYYNLDYTLVYNGDTDNFRFDWNNVDGITTSVCLRTYTVTPLAQTLINSSCSGSPSGTILSPVTPLNSTSYLAKAYYYRDGEYVYLTEVGKTFPAETDLGGLGLLLQLLLTIAMVAVTYHTIPVAVIAAPLSLILGRLIGLIQIGYEYLVPLLVVGFILSFALSNKS